MADTRVPIQKRSIEKKQKILDAGFALFCEKGYYRTNTTEIAKCAGVSTGALYSYFKDKREVYIAALDSYLDRLSDNLFARLEGVCPIDPESFASKGRSTPFAGDTVYGRWVLTHWNGKTFAREDTAQ